MTTTTDTPVPTTPAIDEPRVEAFVGQFLGDLAGAATTAMTVIGDRLGLYQAMTGTGPMTAAQLARSTGLNERLVVEWLASQTVSGYAVHDPAAGTYELPTEHALVLSVVDSPAYVIGVAEILAGQYLSLDLLERAFRGDGGVDYASMPRCLHHGIERFFRTAYVNQLATSWFPSVDGLVARLEGGARVADVGCGRGQSCLIMAERWPATSITGFDLDESSIVVARANAIAAGDPPNVVFRTAEASDVGPGPFDVVVFFDSLHDMGDPVGALRRAREVLVDGGIVVAVEPWSLDRLEDGIGNPFVRLAYANSTGLCTPGSLSQPGAYALGTQGGPARRLALFAEAGFGDAHVAADTGFNLVFAASR